MADAQCLRCGESIAPRTDGRGKKYCSSRCQKLALNQRAREKKREDNRIAQGGVPTQCGECSKPIEPSKYVVRKYCSDACRKRHKNRQTRRSLPPIGKLGKRNCLICGTEFEAKNRQRVYCDYRCAQIAYYRRKRENQPLLMVERDILCDECGELTRAKHPSARWCSKRCANRHWGRVRSRRRGAVPQSPYSDREIFERDGWTCHLCNEAIDPLAPRTEPRGVTIDHLKPIALGGHDVPENVAAAHRKCNIKKMLNETDSVIVAVRLIPQNQ